MALFLNAIIFKYQCMSREQLDILFKQYETSFDKLDLKTVSGYCADAFMSAGPKGTIATTKKEFAEKAKQAVSFYRSVGRKSAKIISKRVMPICDTYTMVVIRWGITFEKTGSKLIEFDITYIVQETGIDPKIILLISHEDEEKAMQKLGLQSKV
jgi:hypothetical protein